MDIIENLTESDLINIFLHFKICKMCKTIKNINKDYGTNKSECTNCRKLVNKKYYEKKISKKNTIVI